MYDSIYLKRNKLNVDICNYLRKHDIIFKTPEYQEYHGIPIGTGCFGGLLYPKKDSLNLILNHTDAIDFIQGQDFGAWGWEYEEKNTAQFGCGQLSITDHQPAFDWLYLKDFEARLNIAEAECTVKAQTPFSEYAVKTFASTDHQVIIMQIDASSPEACEREITLSRWGSRNFFHYYEQMSSDTNKNLANTDSGEKDGCLYVTQTLGQTSFTTCVKPIGISGSICRMNSHTVKLRLQAACRHQFELRIATVINETPETAIQKLNALPDSKKIYESHIKDWRNYWNQSFLYLPQYEYAENLYYFHFYQLRCTCLGTYPPAFGALWTWYGDTRNWGHFYHWNYQQTYWPLHACGHEELAHNYYEYRFGMLDKAQDMAQKLFHIPGAFFSDIANMNGFQAAEPDTVRNFTVGPQIAMNFYKHYLYTNDIVFLRDRAFPFMEQCALLYENMLEKQDGVYYIRGGATNYESYWNVKATISDYSAIKELFSALLQAADILGYEEKTAVWKDIKENLYDIPVSEGTIGGGIDWNGNPISFWDAKYPKGVFGGAPISVVYPHGIIGLKDYGSKIFDICKKTLDRYMDEEVLNNGPMKVIGHTQVIQMAARLGDSRVMDIIERYINTYQIFKNGLFHFCDINNGVFGGDYCVRKIEKNTKRTIWKELHEKSVGERVVFPDDNFRHTYFEAISNIADGLQEMLLQSYDGIIRVFKAVDAHFTGAFTLHAANGFIVSSEINDGHIPYIAIQSAAGRQCRVESPWPGDTALIGTDFIEKDGIIIFDTRENSHYTLYQKSANLEQYYIDEIPGYINQDAKIHDNVQLGSKRNF